MVLPKLTPGLTFFCRSVPLKMEDGWASDPSAPAVAYIQKDACILQGRVVGPPGGSGPMLQLPEGCRPQGRASFLSSSAAAATPGSKSALSVLRLDLDKGGKLTVARRTATADGLYRLDGVAFNTLVIRYIPTNDDMTAPMRGCVFPQ